MLPCIAAAIAVMGIMFAPFAIIAGLVAPLVIPVASFFITVAPIAAKIASLFISLTATAAKITLFGVEMFTLVTRFYAVRDQLEEDRLREAEPAVVAEEGLRDEP